ncbi:hypothetical protein GbCGDNIH6_8192 [Granulibacter bethesdensis]|nr:hypothetical protein GbCGDNIH6_8192 [Granulibacter bethesdensis]
MAVPSSTRSKKKVPYNAAKNADTPRKGLRIACKTWLIEQTDDDPENNSLDLS